jgi:hypothetical protein
MGEPLPLAEPRADVIRQLRVMAAQGATVRELVTEVRTRLAYAGDAVIPVLWYFTQAFCLPLTAVLPIREWLGTDRDDEIDAIILPAIESKRSLWAPANEEQNGPARSHRPNPSLMANDHRS